MSVIHPEAWRPAARVVSTSDRPRARESSSVFMKAPPPVLTSKTMPVVPEASFFERIEAVIRASDSTVAVTSRRA